MRANAAACDAMNKLIKIKEKADVKKDVLYASIYVHIKNEQN